MISASISCCDFIMSDGSKRKVHIAQQQEEEEGKGSSAQKRRPGADHLSGQSRDLASTTVDNLPPSGRYYQSASTKVPKCYYQSARAQKQHIKRKRTFKFRYFFYPKSFSECTISILIFLLSKIFCNTDWLHHACLPGRQTWGPDLCPIIVDWIGLAGGYWCRHYSTHSTFRIFLRYHIHKDHSLGHKCAIFKLCFDDSRLY